jgi:hypothetical protein
MGSGRKKIPVHAGKGAARPAPNAAKTGPAEDMGLMERLVWLQKTAGNAAVNVLMQTMKGAGATPAAPAAQSPEASPQQGAACVVGKAEDPWDTPWSPECRSLNERWAQFRQYLDETNSKDNWSREEKMRAWGDWGQYLTAEEFEKVQSDNYWVKRGYERYLDYYSLTRPNQPHDINFSVSFGPTAADRAEMAGDTLGNITGSIGGAIGYGIAHLFTDDPVKLNAASGMGNNLNNMATGHISAINLRNAQPKLSASRPDVTLVHKEPVKEPVENSPGPRFELAGQGYSTWGFSLNVDERQAVGEPGISAGESMRRALDLGGRQFLDFMTNQATKGERVEVPSSARSAPDLSPTSVKKNPSALLTRPSLGGIEEWDTFAAEVMAKKGSRLAGKTPEQVKISLNKEIVTQLRNPKTEAARAISEALSTLLGLPPNELFRRVKVNRVPEQ